MDVSAVNTQTTAGPPSSLGMNPQDFLKVLITQLQQQDPMQPMQSDQMLSQMATIQQLESSMQLSQVLDNLANNSRVEQAAVMIGKYVRGDGTDADAVTGVVTGIRVQDGKIVLELDSGKTIPLDAVQYVAQTNPSAATAASKATLAAKRAPTGGRFTPVPTANAMSSNSPLHSSPRREISRWI